MSNKKKKDKGKKLYYTDFDKLGQTNYKGLTAFAKEIVDKMVGISLGEESEITAEVQARIDLVLEGIKSLTERQILVLEYSFGLNDKPTMTLREIAEEMDITFQGAYELKDRAIKALRKRVILDESAIKNIKKDS